MGNFINKLGAYQVIPRELIFDNSISDRARFLYCYMASKPNDWDFFMNPMAKEIGYSIDTLRKYINELIDSGWLIKGEQKNDGLFGAVTYTLNSTKNTDTEKVRYGKSHAQHNIENRQKIDRKHEEKVRDKSLTKKESPEKTSGEVSTVLPENRQHGFPTTRITDNTENGEDNNNRPNKHIDLKDHEEINKPLTKKKASDSAWRESMEEYLKEVEKAKEELIEDADFKNKFLGMFPNADYLRSIMKSMQYWTSEKAWELKKKSKTKKINMLSTLKNNLDKSIVYKNQQDAPIENLRKLDIEYSDQEEGTLADGTFIKNGYRYYFSYKDKRAYSIPIKAPRMPGEKCEFDMKTNQWYLPRESETMDEWLW